MERSNPWGFSFTESQSSSSSSLFSSGYKLNHSFATLSKNVCMCFPESRLQSKPKQLRDTRGRNSNHIRYHLFVQQGFTWSFPSRETTSNSHSKWETGEPADFEIYTLRSRIRNMKKHTHTFTHSQIFDSNLIHSGIKFCFALLGDEEDEETPDLLFLFLSVSWGFSSLMYSTLRARQASQATKY